MLKRIVEIRNNRLQTSIDWFIVSPDRNLVHQTKDKDTDPKFDTTNDSDIQSHFRNLSGTQREPKDTNSATKSRKHKPGNLSQESQQPSHLNAETHRQCVDRSNGVT